MSDLETVARWLGAEYVAITRSGAVTIHRKQTYSYAGCPPLDEDQELGAILRRAAELDHEPSLTYRGVAGWRCAMHHHTDGMVIEHDPLPHLAARAAVCKLVGDAK